MPDSHNPGDASYHLSSSLPASLESRPHVVSVLRTGAQLAHGRTSVQRPDSDLCARGLRRPDPRFPRQEQQSASTEAYSSTGDGSDPARQPRRLALAFAPPIAAPLSEKLPHSTAPDPEARVLSAPPPLSPPLPPAVGLRPEAEPCPYASPAGASAPAAVVAAGRHSGNVAHGLAMPTGVSQQQHQEQLQAQPQEPKHRHISGRQGAVEPVRPDPSRSAVADALSDVPPAARQSVTQEGAAVEAAAPPAGHRPYEAYGGAGAGMLLHQAMHKAAGAAVDASDGAIAGGVAAAAAAGAAAAAPGDAAAAGASAVFTTQVALAGGAANAGAAAAAAAHMDWKRVMAPHAGPEYVAAFAGRQSASSVLPAHGGRLQLPYQASRHMSQVAFLQMLEHGGGGAAIAAAAAAAGGGAGPVGDALAPPYAAAFPAYTPFQYGYQPPIAALNLSALSREITALRWLGQGGGGAVFQGVWQGAPVAVKFLLTAADGGSPAAAHAAALEGVVSSVVNHPNVVHTYAFQCTILTEASFGADYEHDEMGTPDLFESLLDTNALYGTTTTSTTHGFVQRRTGPPSRGGGGGGGAYTAQRSRLGHQPASCGALDTTQEETSGDGEGDGGGGVELRLPEETDADAEEEDGEGAGDVGLGDQGLPARGASEGDDVRVGQQRAARQHQAHQAHQHQQHQQRGESAAALRRAGTSSALGGRAGTAAARAPSGGYGQVAGGPGAIAAEGGLTAAAVVGAAAAAAAAGAGGTPVSPMRVPQTEALDSTFQSEEGFGDPDIAGSRRGWSVQQALLYLRAKPGMYMTHIIMEYCDRGSLLAAIKRGIFRMDVSPEEQAAAAAAAAAGLGASRFPRRIVLRAVLRTARDIAQGMCHLHANGIIHGDLKPGNVLLRGCRSDRRGFVAMVADFGLSKIVHGEKPLEAHHWSTVTVMAPEVILGRWFKASDVFSFGVLLWQLVTSEPVPYGKLTVPQILLGVSQGTLKPEWPASAHPAVVRLGKACLATCPEDRPSFGAIVKVLTKIEKHLRDELRVQKAQQAGLGIGGAGGAGGGAHPKSLLPVGFSESAVVGAGGGGGGAGAHGPADTTRANRAEHRSG